MPRHLHGLEPNEAVKSEILSQALLRSAMILALSRQEIGTMIGLSPASISRLCDGKRVIAPHSKEGELALLFLRIYRSLDTLFGGNEQQCTGWFSSHNLHLQGSPRDLVQSIEGLYRVTAYLDAIRGKL